jgi:hypothetical protein
VRDVRHIELLERQDSVIAARQLARLGWSPEAVLHFGRAARRLRTGVYATGHGPLTRRQRWWGAVLAASDSVLSKASAAAAWEIRPWEARFEMVTRPGSGGPRLQEGVLAFRSTTLAGHTTHLDGLPITTPERTITDLAASLAAPSVRKLAREAVRLRRTTMADLAKHLGANPGLRGTADIRRYVAEHMRLPFHRCRSDAEAMALEAVDGAGWDIPAVNVRIAGQEADLSWPDRRLIVEIDGPNFHLFADEDARKTAAWQRAGWTVRRIPSAAVFDEPDRLLALIRA